MEGKSPENEYFVRLVYVSGKKTSTIIWASSGEDAVEKLLKMRQLPGVKIDYIDEVHKV